MIPTRYALFLMLGACSRPVEQTPPPDTSHVATTATAAASAVPATRAASPHNPVPPPWRAPPWLAGGGPLSAESKFGMVTSVEAHATRAGVEILEAGGNAVDAAVAVGYALAVTHPSAGNIGGGGFMLIAQRGTKTSALDFRERAPLALTQAYFDDMIRRGGKGARAAGVPGTVAGLEAAHKRFGRLPRQAVLAPAIRLAHDGFELGQRQAQVLSWAWPTLRRDPEARRLFGPAGRPLRQGQLLKQPELATTLRSIARGGCAGFYQGPVAKAIVSGLERGGSLITQEDLSGYEAKWREPLSLVYDGALVDVMPPPSAGGVAVVEMLTMLQALDAKRLPRGSAQALHVFAEVAKRAHADRRFDVVDPDSVPNYDSAAKRKRWLDPGRWLTPFPIDPGRATSASSLHPNYAAAVRELDHTTHFSVADQDGTVVSCTTTLSASFGAQVIPQATGVVMNNSLGAFGTVGEDTPLAGRRMTSSMSPTIVSYDGRPVGVLGSPGGDTIPNTVVSLIQALVDYGVPLDQAVATPRIHHGFVPDAIRYESLRPPDKAVISALRKLGHAFDAPRRTIGDANNLLITQDGFFGVADAREGGLALGPAQPPATKKEGGQP